MSEAQRNECPLERRVRQRTTENAMKLSEEKRQAAYNAIADTVMDARVSLRMRGFRDDDMDFAIAQITERAWCRLKSTLNIHDAPSNA